MPALSTLFCDFFIFCGFPTTTRLKSGAEYGRIAYEIKPKQELPVNRTLTPDFMFARAADITPEFCRKAEELGLHANMFCSNTDEDNRRFISWGLRGIMTDYTDILFGSINAMKAGK